MLRRTIAVDHQPLYRLEGILGRHDIDITRSTMCGWAGSCADLLEPLYNLMAKDILRSKVINTDDTPVRVQDKNLDRKTRTGRVWIYCGDEEHPYNVYDYTGNRGREGPELFLRDYKRGYLQADAYAGYDFIFNEPDRDVKELLCWSHARRLDGISIEQALPQSPVRQAINYAVNGWAALCRYTEDGDLSIDNNVAERLMRPIAVGRKNWLFFGSDNGGRTAAILFTTTQSAKRHGLNMFSYLKDVIARISDQPANRLGELLPDKWSASQ